MASVTETSILLCLLLHSPAFPLTTYTFEIKMKGEEPLIKCMFLGVSFLLTLFTFETFD